MDTPNARGKYNDSRGSSRSRRPIAAAKELNECIGNALMLLEKWNEAQRQLQPFLTNPSSLRRTPGC